MCHICGVAHYADMRPAVAEPDQRIRVIEHLVHDREIAVRVICGRPIQDRSPVPFQHQVVSKFRRRDTAARGLSRDTGIRIRFVLRRIAEREYPIPLLETPLADYIAARLRNKAGPQSRVAQAGHSRLEGEILDLGPAGAGAKRIDRQLETQQNARRPAPNLCRNPQAFGIGFLNAAQQIAPFFGTRLFLKQCHRERQARACRHFAAKVEFRINFILEVAHSLNPAPPDIGQGIRNLQQFFLRRPIRRDRLALRCPMLQQAG